MPEWPEGEEGEGGLGERPALECPTAGRRFIIAQPLGTIAAAGSKQGDEWSRRVEPQRRIYEADGAEKSEEKSGAGMKLLRGNLRNR